MGHARGHPPAKITFREMRAGGVRGVLVYCSDYRYSHSTAISADRWPDHFRLSGIESRFTCQACGQRGADVRPNYGGSKIGGPEDYMSMIPKIVALALATTLSSPVLQHRIAFSTPGSESQRINQLWLVTYTSETGEEVVVQAKLTNGSYTPLIAADPIRLENMMPAAHDLAKTRNIKMRLIKLTNRVDIEDIAP
jgi:hypothetical protein